MKLPRDASGNEVVKALRRLGFTVVRQTGSHIILNKGHLRAVPNHKAILPKTLQSILRDTNITLKNFSKSFKSGFIGLQIQVLSNNDVDF